MKIGLKHYLLASTLAAAIAPAASAQDNPFLRGRYTAVTERPQPEYDPEVIHAGSFEIVSSLTAGISTNDNVFYQANNTESDTIYTIAPAAEARSNWSSHALAVGFTADHSEYASNDSETTTDYNLYLRGRVDVLRNFRIYANADGGHTTEPRYEPASTNAPEPAQNDNIGGSVTAQYQSDRLRFDATVGGRQNDYQSFYNYRDVSETYLSGRATYAISPDFALFVQARQSNFDYDLDTPVNRDGDQVSVQAGANFELAAPFAGEISVGTVRDNKDNPALADTDSLSLNSRIQWFPTQLTTVTFTGNAGITDPGVPQASSAKYDRYTIRADHELFRNLLLFAQFGFGSYDFEASPLAPVGYSRTDDNREIRAGLTYKLNKHAHFVLDYRMNSRDTSGTLDEKLDVNVISASVRVFP